MKVAEAVGKEHVEYAVEVLKELISIPTVNPPGAEYARCAEKIASRLSEIGFDAELIEIPDEYLDKYYPYRPQHRGHRRLIVYAKRGRGARVLHFNGHYDVVPPGSGWSRDPFTPALEGDRIYGRGSTDMKGGIAAVMAFLRASRDLGLDRRVALEAAFVPDEESGGVGTRYLVERLGRAPEMVIVAEPSTSRRVVIGHKGLVRGVVRVLGKQAHGSSPWLGDNAFLKASALALRFYQLYSPVIGARSTRAPTEDPREAMPTINLGGYAESLSRKDNTVPGEFLFSFDRRVLPDEDLGSVEKELVEILGRASGDVGARHEVEILSSVPPSLTPEESELVRISTACLEKASGIKPRPVISPGRDDSVYYRLRGSQVVALGPGVRGVAHMADEYNTVSEIEAAVKAYTCIAASL